MGGVKISKAITYYLRLINDFYKMLKDHFNFKKKKIKEKFKKISSRYKKVSEEHTAEIKRVYYIIEGEPPSSLYESAGFSVDT